MKINSTLKVMTVAITLPAVALLSGCASRIGANQYAVAGVGETLTSYAGTVISKRTVQIDESQKPGGSGRGAAIGGGTGALVGTGIGGGSGNVAGIIGGAIVGGIVGAIIEDQTGKQTGFEYTVQLDRGDLKTVVQGTDIDIPVGARVLFHESNKGKESNGSSRSRIVPLNG